MPDLLKIISTDFSLLWPTKYIHWAGKGTCHAAWRPELRPQKSHDGGNNWFLEVVLWPLSIHMLRSMCSLSPCTHIHWIHRCENNLKRMCNNSFWFYYDQLAWRYSVLSLLLSLGRNNRFIEKEMLLKWKIRQVCPYSGYILQSDCNFFLCQLDSNNNENKNNYYLPGVNNSIRTKAKKALEI